MAETLPEGTDHIVPGTLDTGATVATAIAPEPTTRDRLKASAADLKDKVAAQTGEYRAQAGDKARDYASQGKDKASGALDEVARLIGDNAAQIDDKIGAQYGDYARRAAEAVSGAADTLRDKDIDELIEDARGLVRGSPALAIGAAAAAGFLLARVIKSGSESLAETAKTVAPEPAAAPKAKKAKKPNGSAD